ncbi:hypothetical protein QFC24_005283 [Naganishia onofrii]|uniref:Uncharacterized protein n=1 Tax=Naganishia onofrii TaxID=1851511 RepID=A0ACC2XAF0_9TREE|nr:hypothetical protein QFC24_005283 [Naganishia onofrii]
MEAYTDLATSTFQAAAAVLVVCGVGYCSSGTDSTVSALALLPLSKKVLLPCFIFATFATSTVLEWRSIWKLWPIVMFTLIHHVISVALGVGLHLVAKCPGWMIESISFNNVSSFPILLWYALYQLTSFKGGDVLLSHLRWRTMETNSDIFLRGLSYLAVNLVVTEFARAVLSFATGVVKPVVVQLEDIPEGEGASVLEHDEDSAESDVDEHPEATESTPLVAKQWTGSPYSPRRLTAPLSAVSPLAFASLAGLVVGLIPGVKHRVADDTSSFWQTFGVAILFLGMVFPVVEMLGIGAGLKAGSKKRPEEKVPPTLGLVLTLAAWKYVALPAAMIAMAYGFRKSLPTKVFLYDPVFAFVLGTMTLSPPSFPVSTSPYRTSVHLTTTALYLMTPLATSAAIATVGRGVSYDTDFDIKRALKSAAGGGLAGAAAMVLQVLALMPLRTIMNYQYRYGGSIKGATKKLYDDGGYKRYYAGLAAALFQGPLSRFGDTAANAGIFALLESLTWPVLVKTIAASLASATFRMLLTPIDTLKTTQQTQGGVAGLRLLRERIKEHGISCLFWGAFGTAGATFVGHYPWFGTYNYLQAHLPASHTLVQQLFRQAFIGFAASVVSDTISNSLRVIKTYRQVHERDVGYIEAAREIIRTEGLPGLFGRGLPTRLLANGIQGLLFSVLWKLFSDLIAQHGGKA